MLIYALGVLLALVAFVLLALEWRQYVRWRRNPEDSIYSTRIFVRRAMVSLLMLTFIALVRFQPLALEGAGPSMAAGYLALYLIVILAIFVLAAVDFAEHRKLAQHLERQMSELQMASVRLLLEAQKRQNRHDLTGEATEDRQNERE